MTAPAGAIVKLYIDTRREVLPGDVIETQSGRRYVVQTVRVQQRGKHAGRKHLACVVLAADEPNPPGAMVIVIRWYRR